MKNSSFSLYEKTLTNETVSVTYKPATTVSSYSYKIYKDEELFHEANSTNSKSSHILLEESGDYVIEVTLHFKNGTTKTEKSGHYILDVDAPYILEKEHQFLFIP